MSLITIQVIDLHCNRDKVDLEDLTQTGLGILIYECELLLEKLKDAEAVAED